MKKFLQISVVLAVLSVAGGLFAQTDENGKNASGTQYFLRKYPKVESKVVSFGGTATATLAVKGRGVLVGVDLTGSSSTGTASTVPFAVAFYDKGSTNNMVEADAGTLIFSQKKIIADVLIGNSNGSISVGAVQIKYDNPVTFESGIVIYNNTSASKGNVGVYWIR